MAEINTNIDNQITDVSPGIWHQTGGVTGPVGIKIGYVPDSLVGEAIVDLRVQYYNGMSFVETVYSRAVPALFESRLLPNQFGL